MFHQRQWKYFFPPFLHFFHTFIAYTLFSSFLSFASYLLHYHYYCNHIPIMAEDSISLYSNNDTKIECWGFPSHNRTWLSYTCTLGKGKAIPLPASTGPEGSRRLRLPDSRQSAHEGGKVVSPMHQSPLPPRKYSWYSFLLEAESTPGP
jgi:hypothetical protein